MCVDTATSTISLYLLICGIIKTYNKKITTGKVLLTGDFADLITYHYESQADLCMTQLLFVLSNFSTRDHETFTLAIAS